MYTIFTLRRIYLIREPFISQKERVFIPCHKTITLPKNNYNRNMRPKSTSSNRKFYK